MLDGYSQLLLISQSGNNRRVTDYVSLSISARLAQSVEHETLNLGVVGSSPTLGELFCLLCFLCFCYFGIACLCIIL